MTVDRDEAERTLAVARTLGDRALTARALTACGCRAADDREASVAYFTEAAVLHGELTAATSALSDVEEECIAAGDALYAMISSSLRAMALAYQGQIAAARTAAEIAFQRLADMFDAYTGIVYAASAFVHLTAGDAAESCELWEAARERTRMDPQLAAMHLWAALAPLACGDIAAARRWADEVVSATSGWSYAAALLARARVKIAQGEFEAAERGAYDGLDLTGRLQGDLLVPVALDCLATTAARTDSLVLATRLFGAADARRMGMVRFKVLEADDQATMSSLRESVGDSDFEEHGPRVQRCRMGMPLPTRCAVAGNASARAAAGVR